jgi:hypothetical protein
MIAARTMARRQPTLTQSDLTRARARRSRLSITQSEVVRALKGFVAAGVPVGRIEVTPAKGTIVIFAADERTPAPDNEPDGDHAEPIVL